MAANYTVIASNRTILVRSSTLSEDVEELHVSTNPSGVTFVRDVPYKTWQAGKWQAGIDTIAAHIEHIMAARPHVLSGSAVQLVGANGLLTNAVEFLVSYDGSTDAAPGPFQSTVTIPVQALHDDDTFDQFFDPTVEALAALANG